MKNEIRTADFRFYRENISRFESFCRRRGHSIGWSQDGVWFKATLIFRNKTERSRFVSGWAAESMEVA